MADNTTHRGDSPSGIRKDTAPTRAASTGSMPTRAASTSVAPTGMRSPRHAKKTSTADAEQHPATGLAAVESELAGQKPRFSLAKMLRKNLRTIIGAVALIVFVSIMMLVRASDALRLDITAHAIIVTRLRSDMITPFMEGFSALASPVVLVVMLIVVAAFAPGRRPGACAALNLGLVVALNTLLKDIVQRPRPEGFRLIDEFGYSFPSGHSMVAMAFYGLLVYLIWHYEHDRLMRWLWSGFMTAVIVMVGISRIYLGVHYASDVLAGFAISVAWLVFYTKVITPMFLPERFARHQKPDPASDPRRPRRRKRS